MYLNSCYCCFIIKSCVLDPCQPGDSAHVVVEEELFLKNLISEEEGKESFTAVVITGIQSDHITYLKQHFHVWTRELAWVTHEHTHLQTDMYAY